MCFSASASFTAATVIGGIGYATLRSQPKPHQKVFASIPFLFAVQQLCEGFIWLSFKHQEYLFFRAPFTLIFLIFAWSIWPIFLPWSMMAMETDKNKKQVQWYLLLLGLVIGISSLFSIAYRQPMAYVSNFHIDYILLQASTQPFLSDLHALFYVICTLLPMFLASYKPVRAFAYINLLAFILAFVFFKQALPSTWCFFAAILSGVIYWILNPKKNTNTDKHQSNLAE
jgi:hypothetical protein